MAVALKSVDCRAREGELEVALELLAQAQVYCHRPVTLLQDLYSTSNLMEVERENQPLCRLTEQSVRPQAVRELLETEEDIPLLTLLESKGLNSPFERVSQVAETFREEFDLLTDGTGR